MLEEFRREFIQTEDGPTIHAMVGGEGPAILLLHGYPQTHLMWHKVAPTLARNFTVVMADLRGYGASDKPQAADPLDADHSLYAKRAMAEDMVLAMAELGFERFHVAGHDRGGRVAHRMALDHPDAIDRIAVLDIVPTLHVFETVDQAMATAYYHWFFLIQPDGMPEHLIGHDPEGYLLNRLARGARHPERFDKTALAAYADAFRDPDMIHATCEDYRAAASIDLLHDREDREAGIRVEAPLLALWGADGFVGRHYDTLTVWEGYARMVQGQAIPDCGHFLPEEQPEAITAALQEFFGSGAPGVSNGPSDTQKS